MRFLFNDASFHGQYPTAQHFLASLGEVMGLRRFLASRGFPLEVCRALAERPAIGDQLFRTVLGNSGDRNQTRQILLWLDRNGPFWEEYRRHPPPQWFECDAEPVTDTALGEACYLEFEEQDPRLVSAVPSRYENCPLTLVWRDRPDGAPDFTAHVPNFTTEAPLRVHLDSARQEPSSWSELLQRLTIDCPSLQFSHAIPEQLGGTFYPQVAKMALKLFAVLEELNAAALAGDWPRVAQIQVEWMSGNNARFSDSSQSEKNDFGDDLTFPHPDTGVACFCPWHGKINHQVYRIHFEWPKPAARGRLFVAYFGPKITKR